MRFGRMLTVVGAHAEGELNEVITGGVVDVPGHTMFDKMRYLEQHGDQVRQLLLNEPRGKINQCVNLVLPTSNPEADIGFVIMESDFYVPMSGTNTICTVTVILETGILPMQEPVTHFTLEAPGGLVKVRAECENGKVKKVAFANVPSFVFGLDLPVEVPGHGTVTVDVAYGGMIYAMVNGASLGLKVSKDEARDLVELGEKIKAAAAEQIPAIHPENPDIHTINQTLFAGPWQDRGAEIHSHNAVIVSPGRIDRSPCGTGTSARMAIMHARGQMKPGQTLVHESLIGTKFYGRILEELTIHGAPAIRPEIAGQAWITAFHQYVLDPTDPFPNGFRLGDLWLGS